MWWFYLVSSVLGYLLGSFPTGYLVGRAHGIDIREHGSKNIGATNVVRVLGKKPGALVFFCDALKGLLAVVLGHFLFWQVALRYGHMLFGTPPSDQSETLSFVVFRAEVIQISTIAGILSGLCCILGHNFPVWLRFKGGKGVATTVGVLLGLMPLAVGISAVVWCATYFISRYVSLASLLGAAVLPVSVWLLTMRQRPLIGPPWLFYFSLLAVALIFWRHRANIQRLLNGTEARFDRKTSPPSEP